MLKCSAGLRGAVESSDIVALNKDNMSTHVMIVD